MPATAQGPEERSNLKDGRSHRFIVVELLPEHSICVTGEDVMGEQLKTFGRMFRSTWHRLPVSVRQEILQLWQAWSEPLRRGWLTALTPAPRELQSSYRDRSVSTTLSRFPRFEVSVDTSRPAAGDGPGGQP